MSAVETATPIQPPNERGSAVRFETQCIVIPDHAHHSRRPRVVTKSYALPLWRKRTPPVGSSVSAPPEDVSLEEGQSHLVLRVPLPTFSRKPTSPTRSVDHTPLTSCLVHRPLPSYPSALSPNRQARPPRRTSPSPSRADIITIPLRPCCEACQSVTEAALIDGDAWPEHFTRAASRRRSASVDGSPRTITIAGSAASASCGALGVAISVDEIDKRRRASDTGPSTTSQETLWPENLNGRDEFRMALLHCRAAASNGSVADARPLPSPSRITPATPRIPEEDDDEDENELFPLPSPKRTPTASPAPSLAGSMSSLAVAHPNQGCGTSPTPSTCSGESTASHPNRQRYFTPPSCPSCSSLSLPRLSESTADLYLSLMSEDQPRAPSPNLLSTHPSLSARHRSRSRSRSRSPSPRPLLSFIPPTPTDTLPHLADKTSPPEPGPSAPIPIPPSRRPLQLPSSPRQSPIQTRLPGRARRSTSVSTDSAGPALASSSSPTLSTASKKSVSSPLQIFTDVLRGVGSLGSGNIAPGV